MLPSRPSIEYLVPALASVLPLDPIRGPTEGQHYPASCPGSNVPKSAYRDESEQITDRSNVDTGLAHRSHPGVHKVPIAFQLLGFTLAINYWGFCQAAKLDALPVPQLIEWPECSEVAPKPIWLLPMDWREHAAPFHH